MKPQFSNRKAIQEALSDIEGQLIVKGIENSGAEDDLSWYGALRIRQSIEKELRAISLMSKF